MTAALTPAPPQNAFGDGIYVCLQCWRMARIPIVSFCFCVPGQLVEIDREIVLQKRARDLATSRQPVGWIGRLLQWIEPT